MILSEHQISHLAHQVFEGLWRDDLVEFRDEALALRCLKDTLARFLADEEEVDALVRSRLQRQHQIPGSREWQVLYDRYFHEEIKKR